MKEMVVMQIFVLIVETKRRGTPSFLLEIIDLMLFSLWQNLHYFIRTPIRLLDNVHGATSSVQKATLQVCKSNVVIAECKALV